MDTVITGQPHTAGVVRPPRRRVRALAVLGATAAALAVWVVAVPLAGVDLAARTGATEQPVGPGAVAVSALLAGLAAWALLAVLERFTHGPGRSGPGRPSPCCWCRCWRRWAGEWAPRRSSPWP